MHFSLDTNTVTDRRRKRYAGLSQQEASLLLKQHTVRKAMAYYDALPAEQKEAVQQGLAVVKGYTWQIQGRDARGRFQSVRV